MPGRSASEEFDAAPDLTPAQAFDAAPGDAPASGPDTEALGRGFGQGASFGFADELSGVLKAAQAKGLDVGQWLATTDLGKATAMQLAKLQGGKVPQRDEYERIVAAAAQQGREDLGLKQGDTLGNYRAGRDEERKANAESKARSPYQYGGAELAGAVMAPGPKVAAGAKGASVLSRAAAYAKAAAPVGALMGLGGSKSDLMQGEAGSAGVDAVVGGAGAALGAGILGPLMEKGGGWLAEALKKRANMNALKASGLDAGIANKLRSLGITTESGANDFGQAARDLGVIKFGNTPADVSENLGGVLSKNAAKKADALTAADAASAGFDFPRAAGSMRSAQVPPTGMNEVRRAAGGAAESFAQQAEAGSGGFKAAEQLRSDVGGRIPWNAPAFGQSSKLPVELQRDAYFALRNSIRDQAGEAAGPAVKKALEDADRAMSTATDLQALANNEATRAPARKAWAKAMTILLGAASGVGASGASPEGAAAGIGLGVVADALAPRLPSAASVTQGALSRAVPAVVGSPGVQTAATRALALKAAALRKLLQKEEAP